MRCLFAGTPEVSAVALRHLMESRHEVVGVLTRPDAPSGRGRSLGSSPVARAAEAAGLPVLRPASMRDPGVEELLRELQPDCCPVVAYGGLIPAALLDLPPRGWVNLHFSLLPAWRGAAPVQWALLTGDEVTGASTFRIEEGLDTGPVYGTVAESVRPDDTAGALLGRLAEIGAGLLVRTLDAIEAGFASPQPQPVDGITYAPKLDVADARIRWTDPAVGVDRRIRACTPEPGAWTTFRGERCKVGPVAVDRQGPELGPGEIAARKDAVWAGTGTAPVRLGGVQPAGRRAVDAQDWARGQRLVAGEAFQ